MSRSIKTPDSLPDFYNMSFTSFRALCADERGQGLVEYALIIALVSIIAIAALKFLGGKASNTLNNAANALAN